MERGKRKRGREWGRRRERWGEERMGEERRGSKWRDEEGGRGQQQVESVCVRELGI